MKNTYINIALRCIAAAILAVLAFSCTKPEESTQPEKDIEPVFPTLVENYQVTPGEKLTLTITPNFDWEVSIPQDAFQWFQILDGTFKLPSISGKASDKPVTITIQVSDQEEFDTNRSVEVSLTMNGKTKVIAKYMRPAKDRTIAIYPAELNADGSLKLAEDGQSYVYSSKPAESLSLVWSASDSDFRAPVKVEANFAWTLSLPEWAETRLPENIGNVEEIVITGTSIDGAQGKAEFKAGDSVMKEVSLTVPSCGEIKVYAATHEGGEWKYSEGGDYLWTESAVDETTLVWMGADFRMPVKIDSKCNWDVEVPEWLNVQLPENGLTCGEISINLMGVPSKYPTEDTSGSLVFKYQGSKLYELKVNIPGCREMVSHSLGMQLLDLEFNYSGQFNTSTGYVDAPALASFRGTSLSCIVAVEKKDGKYLPDADVEWLIVDADAYSKAEGADVIQTREVRLSVSENLGNDRYATLFFLPYLPEGGKAGLFNEDKTEVNEAYAKYAVSVMQHSSDMDYLTVAATEEEMTDAGASFAPASESKKAELLSAFGETKYVYSLAYTKEYAHETAILTLARPYTEVKMFGQDKAELPEGSWLQFKSINEGSQGEITMYLNQKLPLEPSVGYVVFYLDGAVLAIVECTSPKIEPLLGLAHSYIDFGADASVGTLSFDCNVAWTISSAAEWCTVTPESGEGNGTIKVSVTENEGEARSTVLIVTYAGKTAEISINQEGVKEDEGPEYEFSNGDSKVHFVDAKTAEEAGAALYRLTSGELYDSYREGDAPVYHLVYTDEATKLNITLPRTVKTHINNPYKYSSYFSVNDNVYGEYFGPNDLLNEVVRDSKGSVSITMTMPSSDVLPEGVGYLRGTIHFLSGNATTSDSSANIEIILICTLDPTE